MSKSNIERKFGMWWIGLKGPDLHCEYTFHNDRKWRFDFAHISTKTAIEIEGGIRSIKTKTGKRVRGHHTTPDGYAKDCEKYNTALLCGWTVFRLTPGMIKVPLLERMIAFVKWREINNAEAPAYSCSFGEVVKR